MNDENMDAVFNRPLRDFLESRGYSHIISVGVDITDQLDTAQKETDIFWLEPIKPDDPRLNYEEAEHLIQAINDSDVFDMAGGVDAISFMVKIPVVEYNDYVKPR